MLLTIRILLFLNASAQGNIFNMSRDMTKPTKRLCTQQRSAWASAKSDKSLRCPHEETSGPQLLIEPTAKTLIRLCGCPGWTESSQGAHSFCWFCHVAARMSYLDKKCCNWDWQRNVGQGQLAIYFLLPCIPAKIWKREIIYLSHIGMQA